MCNQTSEDKEKIHYISTHANDIEIIESYIKIKQIGDIYRSRCPFHNERTPSFTIYPKGYRNYKQVPQDSLSFYCFGCGVSGNIVDFVNKIEKHETYEQTFDFFADKYGITFGQDEQLLEIKQKLKLLETLQPKNIMSLNEINIKCSSYCRRYLFYVKEEYPQWFYKEFDYLQSLYIWLDNELNEKPAVELQGLYLEVMKKINTRKSQLRD